MLSKVGMDIIFVGDVNKFEGKLTYTKRVGMVYRTISDTSCIPYSSVSVKEESLALSQWDNVAITLTYATVTKSFSKISN